MASGSALGKANETSGLTEPSRYSIYRVDAHAEKPTGDQVRLKHGAESWWFIAEAGCGLPEVTVGAVESGAGWWRARSAGGSGGSTRPSPGSAS
jgi:hypothetical protein